MKIAGRNFSLSSPWDTVFVNRPDILAATPRDAAPSSPKDVVAWLNQRHFLIRNIGGKCLVGEMVPNPTGSGQMLLLQSREDFRAWYGNEFVIVSDSQGNSKRKPVGEYWLKDRDRRGYEGVDLVPNAPEELPNGYLNLWRGLGVEPKLGAWPLMLRHVGQVLAAGERKAAEYILRWAAWAVQHPGERAEVALVLKGGKGCGKGVFVRALKRCFGEHGMQISNQEHLVGKFNGHLRSCLFLFADEAFWAGDKKGESVLKGLITEPCLVIEQKGIDAVQWPNRLKIAMAANADWVVPASAGERRYAVFGCADTYVRGETGTRSARPTSTRCTMSWPMGGRRRCCTTWPASISATGIRAKSMKPTRSASRKSKAFRRPKSGSWKCYRMVNFRGRTVSGGQAGKKTLPPRERLSKTQSQGFLTARLGSATKP